MRFWAFFAPGPASNGQESWARFAHLLQDRGQNRRDGGPKKMCLSRTWFNGRAQFANPLHTSLLILLVVKPSPDVGGRFNDQISEPTPATFLPGLGQFLVFLVPVLAPFALLGRSRRRINDQRSRTGRYSRTVSKAPVRILIRSPASLGKPDGS